MVSGKKCVICKIVVLLVGIGAVNWGVVGLLQVDLVARMLGYMSGPARVVYTLIGVAGVLALASLVKCCPCAKESCKTK